MNGGFTNMNPKKKTPVIIVCCFTYYVCLTYMFVLLYYMFSLLIMCLVYLSFVLLYLLYVLLIVRSFFVFFKLFFSTGQDHCNIGNISCSPLIDKEFVQICILECKYNAVIPIIK